MTSSNLQHLPQVRVATYILQMVTPRITEVEQLTEGHPAENEILNQLKIKSSNDVRRNRAASGFHTLPGTFYPKGLFPLVFSLAYPGRALSPDTSIQRTNYGRRS